MGLAHPNHATESGLSDPAANGTKSGRGVNTVFDQGAGADTRHGSSDDVRGDDVNLHWYLRNLNDPGQLPAVFDSSTLAVALNALPSGHTFAANADRAVMAACCCGDAAGRANKPGGGNPPADPGGGGFDPPGPPARRAIGL